MNQEQLDERIAFEPTTGCWLWTGPIVTRGYGIVHTNRRHVLAHRMSWEIHKGPIPDGLFVCHHCDTTSCVCPDHLFLGTHGDNARDKERKGRSRHVMGDRNGSRLYPEHAPMGERNGNAKLSEVKVRLIRDLHASGDYSQSRIAAISGLSQQHVSKIVRGVRWRHVV